MVKGCLPAPPRPAPLRRVRQGLAVWSWPMLRARVPREVLLELQQLVCKYRLTGYAELVGALLKGLLTDRLQVARLVRDHKRAERVRMRQHVAKFRNAA